MSLSLTTPNTILGNLQGRTDTNRIAFNVLTVVLGSLLLWASAKISVPTWPVPVTLQTAAIAGLSAAFGWRIGVATVALYLAEGLAGLPVFAFGGGAGYLFGPTGGFLIGYLPMAYIIGRAADAGASSQPVRLFAWMVVGDAIVFALGFAWLVAMAGSASWVDQNNVVASAYEKAVQPFIIWDLVKLAFATITVTGIFALLRKQD